MEIIFTERCLEYFLGKGHFEKEEHPEKAARVLQAYKALKRAGYRFTEPEMAIDKDLMLVHSKGHIKEIREGTFFDIDTPFVPRIYEYAAFAAGGAIKAAETALGGKKAFSLMRPPGHHASREKAEGFCYFNNIAIAAEKLLNGKKAGKIAILDTDLHHGNGTESIFLGGKDVVYASLHLSGTYPNTGKRHTRNSFNFPLDNGTDEKRYLKSLEDALSRINDFKPEILGISAGFDTHKQDPVENQAFLIDNGYSPRIHFGFSLETSSFKKIGKMIKALNLPTFCVMEGGYGKNVGESVKQFISGLD